MNRRQIRDKVRRTVDKANKIWSLSIAYPIVDFFYDGDTAGWAVYYPDRSRLSFNLPMAELNGFRHFSPIIIHEVAHIVAEILHPTVKQWHGIHFQRINHALGGTVVATHHLVVPPSCL